MDRELVIDGVTVMTMDASNRVLRDTSIAVRGRDIAAIGPAAEVRASYPGAEIIDGNGMVALPGLINGHVHAFTALYKGTMTGLGFFKIALEIVALFDDLTPEMMKAASRLAAAELLRAGVTTANIGGDAVTFEQCQPTAEVFGEAGMKVFLQTIGGGMLRLNDLDSEAQIAVVERLVHDLHGGFDGHVRVTLGPAIEITQLNVLRRLAALADREDLIAHIHLRASPAMDRLLPLTRGRTSVSLLEAAGLLNERLIAVHLLGAGRGMVSALARARASVAFCPSVWMNMGVGPRGWPPIDRLLRAGVNVTLGTDSLGGFIEGTDMFTEMRNCALMSAFLYGPGAVKPIDVLRMATVNGARALGIETETGSLEVGKRADVVLLRFNKPPLIPSSDVPAMAVYAGSSRDVDTVLVDGRVLVRDGRVLSIDEDLAVSAAIETRAELYRRGGWQLGPDGAVSPRGFPLWRFPNRRVAALGRRSGRQEGTTD